MNTAATMQADLSDEEIDRICRPLTQNAAKVRYLRSLGLVVRRRPDGTPLVSRAHYDAVTGAGLGSAMPARQHDEYQSNGPGRSYEGSALQRYHLAQNAEARARAERERVARERWEASAPQRRAAATERRSALVRHHSARRRVKKLLRTPSWADEAAIRAVYDEARRLSVETGIEYHVDHVVPLQGRLVSGLHVHNNLRIIPATENCRKRNKFEVE